MSSFAPIVTVTPTVMDGTVVRWFRTIGQANLREEPSVTASRNRVTVCTSLIDAEQYAQLGQLVEDALTVMRRLRAGDDVRDLATHRKGALQSALEPVGG